MLEERLEEPPIKRQRVAVATRADESLENDKDSALVRRHPLGVRPSGNAFTAGVNLKSSFGLFARLPDELLASFLEYLDAETLLRLGSACRGLYAFTRNEDLWRALFVEYVAPSAASDLMELFRKILRIMYTSRASAESKVGCLPSLSHGKVHGALRTSPSRLAKSPKSTAPIFSPMCSIVRSSAPTFLCNHTSRESPR